MAAWVAGASQHKGSRVVSFLGAAKSAKTMSYQSGINYAGGDGEEAPLPRAGADAHSSLHPPKPSVSSHASCPGTVAAEEPCCVLAAPKKMRALAPGHLQPLKPSAEAHACLHPAQPVFATQSWPPPAPRRASILPHSSPGLQGWRLPGQESRQQRGQETPARSPTEEPTCKRSRSTQGAPHGAPAHAATALVNTGTSVVRPLGLQAGEGGLPKNPQREVFSPAKVSGYSPREAARRVCCNSSCSRRPLRLRSGGSCGQG